MSATAADVAPLLLPDADVRQLRALVNVAAAVAGAYAFEDVLETAAEEVNRALGSASSAISRWDREDDVARTLINAGDLSPGEERFPVDETYSLADYPRVVALLERGEPYACGLDDEDPTIVAMLEELGKTSTVGVPIVFGGRTWGVLDVFSIAGDAPFAEDDVAFLEAVAQQLAMAIGRAEHFARTRALAYEDALTGLRNRRALDERLQEAVTAASASGRPLAVVFCDLDGLKTVNDAEGHEAGDRALRLAAETLVRCPGAIVGRMGGDEFCLVLEGADADEARALAADASDRLSRASGGHLTLSAGVATLDAPFERPSDLLRRADAAQYAAKRAGRGLVSTAGDLAGPSHARDPRTARDRGHERVLERVLTDLDATTHAPPADRLRAVARAYAAALGATGWSIAQDGLVLARAGGAGAGTDRAVARVRRGDRAWSLTLAGEPAAAPALAAAEPELRLLAQDAVWRADG